MQRSMTRLASHSTHRLSHPIRFHPNGLSLSTSTSTSSSSSPSPLSKIWSQLSSQELTKGSKWILDIYNKNKKSTTSTSTSTHQTSSIHDSITKSTTSSTSAAPSTSSSPSSSTSTSTSSSTETSTETSTPPPPPPLFISTRDSIEGRRVVREVGIVTASAFRSKNIIVDIVASVLRIFGGETPSYTSLLNECTEKATQRLLITASQQGATSVVRVMYSTTTTMNRMIFGMHCSVLAYGTAVIDEAIPVPSTPSTSTSPSTSSSPTSPPIRPL